MRSRFYKKKVGDITLLAPRKLFLRRLEKTIESLYLWDEMSYFFVRKNLKTILIHPRNAIYNHTEVSDATWISGYQIFADKDYDLPYVASLLLHEAVHVNQFREGKPYTGGGAEKAAMKAQKVFLRKIGYDYAADWLDMQYKKKWWLKMDADTVSKDNIQLLMKKFKKK